MQLLSIGRLYVGIDDFSQFDLLVHVWRLRVEWDQSTQTDGPNQGPNNQCTTGQALQSHEPDSGS